MPGKKILYITTEMYPYQEESSIASMVHKMALKMHGAGNDVRVFMPKFGLISERKFQLHEVIRLSGMNIIINDLDQPLIIKVASLPGERLQVYFIDNEEYFKRKQYYVDENGAAYDDNDERAVFFARGVLETIKKLNWVPDVIHLNGWMASVIPLYLRTFYKGDIYFNNTKMIMSVYNEPKIAFTEKIKDILKFDKVSTKSDMDGSTSQTFTEEAMNYVDLLVKGDEFLEDDLYAAYDAAATPKKDFIEPDNIESIYD